MNEQEKVARFSTQVDQLLHAPARFVADDLHSDDEQALLELAREMAMLDLSSQSQFLRRGPQPKGAKSNMSINRNGRRALATVALAMMLMVTAVFLIAPVRTFAQDIWQSLFVRHESDRVATEPYRLPAEPTSTPIPMPDAAPQMSVAEAAALAPFAVKELRSLPEGFALKSVYYDETLAKVTFLYANEAYLGIVFHQEPAETAEAWEIGSGAVVEAVVINGAPGEYVQGAWLWVEPANGASDSTEVAWVNDDPHQQLRWTQDGIAYTVSTTLSQDLGLTKADLVALAESAL